VRNVVYPDLSRRVAAFLSFGSFFHNNPFPHIEITAD